MISETYRAQVDLLLQVLPHVAKEESFALKGGTAINLFVRDMPRLSVDIDLTWLPFDDRATALVGITDALRRVKARDVVSTGAITSSIQLKQQYSAATDGPKPLGHIMPGVKSTTLTYVDMAGKEKTVAAKPGDAVMPGMTVRAGEGPEICWALRGWWSFFWKLTRESC
jgi:hypothetical protein